MNATSYYVDKLKIYIQGAMPLIHVQTNEYDRVLVLIINELYPQIKESFDMLHLFLYDHARGIVDLITGRRNDMSLDIALLDIIESKIPTLMIIRNLEQAVQDPIQKLRVIDALLEYHRVGQVENMYIINIGIGEVPIELRPYFVNMDFPLPSTEEIYEEIKSFLYMDDESSLFDVSISDQKIKKIAELCKGMTLNEVVNAISSSIIAHCGLSEERIREEKAKIVRKSGLLEWIEDLPSFEEVGGFDLFKEWLTRMKKVINNYEKAQRIGIKPPKGVLITGVPGTGKSLTAKAIASMFNLPLFLLDVGRLMSSFVGETERNTREALRLIEALSPCVVLMDEIEKALSYQRNLDSGVTARLLGNLLYFLQERKSVNFFVCTSNDITLLPPEFIRKGRFDEIWFVDLPNEEERKEIWNIHLGKTKIKKEVEIESLVTISDGYTGAEIEEVVQQSLIECFCDKKKLTNSILEKHLKEIVPLSQMDKERIEKIRKWAKLSGARRVSSIREIKKGNGKIKRKKAILQ